MAVRLGYKNIYRDPLGFPAWQSQGLPVASDPLGLCDYAPEAFAPGLLFGWGLLWTMLGIFAGGMALGPRLVCAAGVGIWFFLSIIFRRFRQRPRD